jgi:hypothetical protein
MKTPNMKNADTKTLGTLAALSTVAPSVSHAVEAGRVDEFIAQICSTDDSVRGPAWQGAAPHGAPAVRPLAAVMTDSNFEVARAAKRALWKIVRHAGRPGAKSEATAVQVQLLSVLPEGATPVRREVLWMLSEIGGPEVVSALAASLSDPAVREDARCVLIRVPDAKALAAIEAAMAQAPEDFKFALADALRARGVNVADYPSRKLVPTRATRVGQPE